jgi:hypothetical protein
MDSANECNQKFYKLKQNFEIWKWMCAGSIVSLVLVSYEPFFSMFFLLFSIAGTVVFCLAVNKIWFLANEAGRYGSLWALGSLCFAPFGFIVAFVRIKKIAQIKGWSE